MRSVVLSEIRTNAPTLFAFYLVAIGGLLETENFGKLFSNVFAEIPGFE